MLSHSYFLSAAIKRANNTHGTVYSDQRSPKRFIISFLTGARWGFLRLINAMQAILSFTSGRGFIGITFRSRLALSIYAWPGLFSRWGDCGKMSRHCEGHWQFRAHLELAGEPSPRTARGHAKWRGDKSLKSSNEDATNMRSCMHSLVGRAVTVLDQDRSDRSWSWDQGLVLEVRGEIGPQMVFENG